MLQIPQRALTRRQFLRDASLAAAAVGLASCGVGSSSTTSSKKGGTLRIAFGDGSSGDSLLLYKMPNFFTPVMFLSMYETLTKNDTGFQSHPNLAESWENSADAMTWTFHLRKGVKFHDGSPLTAKDVVYSLQQEMLTEHATYTGSLLRPVLSPNNIIAVDDSTVQFKLDKSFVFLPYVLGIRYSLIFKAGTTDSDLKSKNPVGTGPFIFQSFSPGQSFVAKRNPNYWQQGKPYVDGLHITNIPEASSKVQALVSGQADLVDNIDFAQVGQLKNDSNAEPFPFNNAAWQAAVCDLTVHPFDNPNFIKAMKLGVDRQQCIDTAYAGLAGWGYDNPIPADDPYFPSSLQQVKRDVAAAKSALSGAGYPNGITLPFDLVTVPGFGIDSLAAAMQQQLAEVGIHFNIKDGGPTFWDTVYEHDPFYIPDWNRRHPFEIYGLLTTTENMTKFKSQELSAALSAASQTTDLQKQKQFYGQAISITAEQDGYVLPAYAPRLHAKSRKLQGVGLNFVQFMDFTEAQFV